MSEPIIQEGKHVQLTYSIRDETGDVVEQSDLPIHYQQGSGSGLFTELAAGLAGHKVGDVVTVRLPPDKGFGEYSENLTFTDDIENVPEEYQRVGAEAEFQNERGETRSFTVTQIDNGKVLLDGNHPFAGKTVTFRMTVLSISDEKPTETEPAMMPNPNPGTIN